MVGEINDKIEPIKEPVPEESTCVDIETKGGFKFHGQWWTVPLYVVVISACLGVLALVFKVSGFFDMLKDVF
jgi:hypothetical protein